MPITWKNVNGGIDPAAVRLLDNAQASFNTGLSGITDIVKAQQSLRDSNRAVTIDNNTQTFLDTINKHRTVAGFNEAQQAGEFDVARQAFGGLIDNKAASAALEARPGQLINLENSQHTFDDNMFDRVARPHLEAIAAANATNDDAGRATALEAGRQALIDSGDWGRVNADAVSQDRKELEQGRDDTSYGQQQVAYTQGQEAYQRGEAARIRGEASDALVNESTSNYFDNRWSAEMRMIQAADDAGLVVDIQGNPDYNNATEAQITQFKKLVQERGIDQPASQTDIRQNMLATLRGDPAFKGMTPQEQIDAVARLDATLVNATALAQGDRNQAQAELESAGRFYNIQGNGYHIERDLDKSQLAVGALTEISKSSEALSDLMQDEDFQQKIVPAVKQALESGVEVTNPETKAKETIPLTSADVKLALVQLNDEWLEYDADDITKILTSYAESAGVAKKFTDFVEYTNLESSISNRLNSAAGQDQLDEKLAALRAALPR